MTRSLLVLLVALSALANRAFAQTDIDSCVSDHKLVQTARESGHYLESRDAAARCALPRCPKLIRQDCTAWFVDLSQTTPSLVIDVRDEQGRDVPDAHVSAGGRPLDEALRGRAVALDPGSYELRVEAAGYQPLLEKVMLRHGEKDRKVSLTLRSVVVPAAVAAAVPASAPQQVPEPRRESAPAVITLGTIGLTGLATFAALGIAGKLAHNDLEHCKDTCSPAEVEHVNRLYLGADIAAAVGGAAAIAATTTYFIVRKRAQRLDVGLSPLSVTMRGAF